MEDKDEVTKKRWRGKQEDKPQETDILHCPVHAIPHVISVIIRGDGVTGRYN